MKRSLSLRTLLVVPLILQLALTAALISAVSYRNDLQASDAITTRSQHALSGRVREYLVTYLSSPQRVIRLMADEVISGRLDLADREATGRYLWELHRVFPDAPYLNYGLANGNFIGLGQVDNIRPQPFLELADAARIDELKQYRLDDSGERIGPPLSKPFDDFRHDGWYANPLKARRAVWIPIYNWVDAPEVMAMGVGVPIQRRGTLIGVAEVDVFLSNISRYLRQLPISRSGMIFLVDQDGLLVADASENLPFTIKQGKAIRQQAQQAHDPMVRQTARAVVQRHGSFQSFSTPRQLRLPLSGGSALVRVEPYHDQVGLNWRIVVVTPEADVNGGLRQRALQQFLLSLAVILLSAGVALAVVQFVIGRLRQLVISSDAMVEGDLSQRVDPGPIRELALLAESFNAMAERLRRSFSTLRSRNRDLRRLIGQRSQELASHQQQLLRESRQRQALELMLQGSDGQQSDLLTDPLTGLFTRRGLWRRWSLLQRPVEEGEPCPLALLELAIRACDSSGGSVPLSGEQIVGQVTPLLEALAADSLHLLAHDGHGRFSLLLPGRRAKEADAWLRRLREALAALSGSSASADHILSFQAGIAVLEPSADAEAQQRLWDRAEEALRQAQALGSSGWVVAP